MKVKRTLTSSSTLSLEELTKISSKDRKTERQKDKKTERQRDRQRQTERHRETEIQKDIQNDIKIGTQRKRQKIRKDGGKQKKRQKICKDGRKERVTEKHNKYTKIIQIDCCILNICTTIPRTTSDNVHPTFPDLRRSYKKYKKNDLSPNPF